MLKQYLFFAILVVFSNMSAFAQADLSKKIAQTIYELGNKIRLDQVDGQLCSSKESMIEKGTYLYKFKEYKKKIKDKLPELSFEQTGALRFTKSSQEKCFARLYASEYQGGTEKINREILFEITKGNICLKGVFGANSSNMPSSTILGSPCDLSTANAVYNGSSGIYNSPYYVDPSEVARIKADADAVRKQNEDNMAKLAIKEREKQEELKKTRECEEKYQKMQNRLLDTILNLKKEIESLKKNRDKYKKLYDKFQRDSLDKVWLDSLKRKAIAAGRLEAKGASEKYNIAKENYYLQNTIEVDSFRKIVDETAAILVSKDSILGWEEHLVIVDIFGKNRTGIIERIDDYYDDAKGFNQKEKKVKANQVVLVSMGEAARNGKSYHDPTTEISNMVYHIDEFIQPIYDDKDVSSKLQEDYDLFKKGEHLKSLSNIFQDQNLLESPDVQPDSTKEHLWFQVMYVKGATLLWNLGNIEGSKHLVTNKRFLAELNNRTVNGKNYLKQVISKGKDSSNPAVQSIVADANIALHKYYSPSK